MERLNGHPSDPLAEAIDNLRLAVVAIRGDAGTVVLNNAGTVDAVVAQLRRTVGTLRPDTQLAAALSELATVLEERFQ